MDACEKVVCVCGRGCVAKMVCNKDVCERCCVTKMCVEDGVWQSCVWKTACDKDMCERWVCDKDDVWKMMSPRDKDVCERHVHVAKCHACQNDSGVTGVTGVTRDQPSPRSATLARQNEGPRHMVPRLPRKTTAASRASLGVRHACHAAKGRSVSPSATPATQNGGGCRQVTKMCVKGGVWKMVCDKGACERWCVTKMCVKVVCESCVWKRVCDRWRVWKRCVWKMACEKGVCERWVCNKDVCERWCVTTVCVKEGVWKMVCDNDVCERWCVTVTKTKRCDKDVCERWEGGEGEAEEEERRSRNREVQIQNKNPTQWCGEKCFKIHKFIGGSGGTLWQNWGEQTVSAKTMDAWRGITAGLVLIDPN